MTCDGEVVGQAQHGAKLAGLAQQTLHDGVLTALELGQVLAT